MSIKTMSSDKKKDLPQLKQFYSIRVSEYWKEREREREKDTNWCQRTILCIVWSQSEPCLWLFWENSIDVQERQEK